MNYMRVTVGTLFALLLVACSAPPSGPGQAQPEKVQSSRPSFSGEEMFTGLVLGRGSAASLLRLSGEPLLDVNQSQEEFVQKLAEVERNARSSGATPESLQRLRRIVENAQRGEVTPENIFGSAGISESQTVESIRTKDPTYFETFRAELTSGDHLRIRTALGDAFERVRAEANASPTAHMESASGLAPAIVVLPMVNMHIIVSVDVSHGANLRQDMLVERLSSVLAGSSHDPTHLAGRSGP